MNNHFDCKVKQPKHRWGSANSQVLERSVRRDLYYENSSNKLPL